MIRTLALALIPMLVMSASTLREAQRSASDQDAAPVASSEGTRTLQPLRTGGFHLGGFYRGFPRGPSRGPVRFAHATERAEARAGGQLWY